MEIDVGLLYWFVEILRIIQYPRNERVKSAGVIYNYNGADNLTFRTYKLQPTSYNVISCHYIYFFNLIHAL